MTKVILPFSDNELLKKHASIYPNATGYPTEENLSWALISHHVGKKVQDYSFKNI